MGSPPLVFHPLAKAVPVLPVPNSMSPLNAVAEADAVSVVVPDCVLFGRGAGSSVVPDCARRLKRQQGRLGDPWCPDEVSVTINGQLSRHGRR